MHRRLFALGALLAACVPRVETRPVPEVAAISSDKAEQTVGDTFRLSPTLARPDTLLPQYVWESRNPLSLSVTDNGAAIFGRPDTATVCVSVWYFYKLKDGYKESLRNSSNIPTCKTFTGRAKAQ